MDVERKIMGSGTSINRVVSNIMGKSAKKDKIIKRIKKEEEKDEKY